MSQPVSGLPAEAAAHYNAGIEQGRLADGLGALERIRTQDILSRYLLPPPVVILDVGGGPGIYSCWLAALGYEVHLIDALPLHVSQAEVASRAQPEHPVASLAVGDARHLARPDASADVVLLFGPLYHLTERADRLAALAEAQRVLRPGGFLFAVGISRFASSLDGLWSGYLDDPAFQGIVDGDLTDGQHRNSTGDPRYFTTAFFHRPDEFRVEVEATGLRCEVLLAIEGPGWLLPRFPDHWNNPERHHRLLGLLRRLEAEPTLLGASAHFMAVGRKPA
jgi:SAM-dependent methyltransferase